MRITVQLPMVMKMQFDVILEVSESESLPDINRKVFDAYWRFMSAFSDQYGTPKDIALRDKDGIEIISGDSFRSNYGKGSVSMQFLSPKPTPSDLKGRIK